MDSIHARIRQRREALGLSQSELARRLGVSYQTVQMWEREPDPSRPGTSTAPKRARLAEVAQILGVTPEWLLTGRDPEGRAYDPIADQLVSIYRTLPDELQEVLVQQANALLIAADPTRRSVANPYPGVKPPRKPPKPE